tara:strand:- start:504 stop:713 length:210 start_codon:yes stop_codon:yes gene_type:complete
MPIITNLDVVLAKNKMLLSELSKKVNVSIVNLSRLKKGNVKAVRFSTLSKICKVLNCKPGDILDYKEDK